MRRYLVMLAEVPKNKASRRAERKVMRWLNYKETKLSKLHRLWYTLNERDNVEQADGEACYFAIHQESGIRCYIAKSDVIRTIDV